MPRAKHIPKVGKKEQRMYEHILENARKSGRYKGRSKEIAARTVRKHHQEEGHETGK